MTSDKERDSSLKSYAKILRPVPDQPEVFKFVDREKKEIIINTAARKGVKVIKLLPEPVTTETERSNMENENNGYALWENIFGKQIEDNRMREAEMQLRYAERRAEKQECRRKIEQAAGKICAMVDASAEKSDITPGDIAMLAGALGSVATALHAAENYAESRPYYTSPLAIGTV